MDCNRIFGLLSFLSILPFGCAIPPQHEVSALLDFAKGIKSDPHRLVSQTWIRSEVESDGCPARSWHGVTCSGGYVTAIALNHLNLAGEVTLQTLTQLRMLTNLSLSNNSLSGELQSEITTMSSLQHLDLSNNRFRGPIPKGFENLQKLSYLDLHSNCLTGHIKKGLLRARSLEYVDLSSNMFSGPLPSVNIINGSIRHTLQHLNVSNNRLTGFLVVSLLVPFDRLRVLDMSNNLLAGSLPLFDYVYALEILRLAGNRFSGPLPSALFIESSLPVQEIDLSNNNLSGNIHMVLSTTLKVINLSSNKLSGPLPIKFGNCEVVNLHKNNLSGNLSVLKNWGNYIEKLDLSENSFSGIFPNDTSQFLRLTYLNLSHNTLEGLLPPVLGTYPVITVIDLAFNYFSGPILPSLFRASNLAFLCLSHNNLSGVMSLPNSHSVRPEASLAKLSPLESLDLSDNLFNGNIPPHIGDFVTLKTLNLAGNQLSGTIPRELSKLQVLVFLDLSSNHLKGNLPENLPDSLRALNVTHNDLSGVVPPNLRRFPESSFHPGNNDLLYPHVLPSTRGPAKSLSKKHKRIKAGIKAIIIGTCTAAAAFLLVLALILYLRKNSRLSVFGRHASGQGTQGTRGLDRDKSLVSRYSTSHKHSTAPHPICFSEEEILSPQKRIVSSFSAHATDFAEKGTLKTKERDSSGSPSKDKRRSSPGSSSYLSSPHSEDTPTSDNPVILKVQSPDRLAGELFFLDDTLIFTAEELSRAPAEVLGRSHYGTSYKATLDSGYILTVKWLREGLAKSKNEFVREAKKFRKIRHPNLVSMRGYYWGPREHEKLILSDYINTGNLAKHLYDRSNTTSLTWPQRVRISVDASRGLLYLHQDLSLPHGNLKATNVLVDGPDLTGKLSDYCLHLLTTSGGTAEQILNSGALGYRAPELASARKPKPSFKADIYAFGVVLIEILTGKSASDIVCEASDAMDLTDWVTLLASEGRGMDCIDSSLQSTDTEGLPKGTDDLLGIALQCIRPASERPTIRTVFEDLTAIGV